MKKFLLYITIVVSSLQGYTVSQIEFEGLYRLSVDSAKELITFSEGEVSPQEIDTALKRLYSQGYFKDISVDYTGTTLTFKLVEKPIISRVSLSGFLDSQEEQQAELLTIKKGSIYDDKRVEENRQRILEGMNFKGTIDNVVEVKSETLENGSIDLQFLAREGEEIIIDKLNLYGVKSFNPEDIEAEMSNKQRDALGWLIGFDDGKMKIRELQIDSMKIREFYLKHGYLDVKVSKPLAEVDFKNYRATLSFSIDEGKQYTLRDVDLFIDDSDIVDEVKLKSRLLQKSGEFFDVEKLRKDLQIVKQTIADKGYAFVTVNPDIQKSGNSVDVKYSATIHNKVYIRDVIVSSNNRTLDRVIRREVFLAPGDLYNLTDLIDSKNALGRLGYFETVDIEERRIGEDQMDLIISVKESPTGSIQIGGGYSSYSGMLFNAGVQDRNIFGSGISLGLDMQYSELSTNYSLSLSNPRINDSLYSGGASIFRREFTYTYDDGDYTSKNTGFGLNVGKRFTRNIRGSIGYNYSDTVYDDVSSEYSYINTSYSMSTLSLNLNYDTTDDFFVPRKGVRVSNSLGYSGPGGTAKFVRDSFSFGAYKGLEDSIGFDLILRYKMRARAIFDTSLGIDDSFIPINESLYLGGVGSIRGYESFAFPDRDKYKNFIGKRFFVNSIEASLPISKKARLRTSLFVDYGYLNKDKWINGTGFQRGGYGISLDWISPMAPIQFIFSRPIDDKPGDETSKFEFTIGQQF